MAPAASPYWQWFLTALLSVLLPTTKAHALPTWPSISQGASGTDTKTAQYLLRHHGYGIVADGAFGPATASAYAITSGVVDHYNSTSCGIGIRLLQPSGACFVYCHLSARSVADGTQVGAGVRLGTIGDTGNSGAPHLHVEIRTSDGVARCPQSYLLAIYDGLQPPSLTSLPTTGCTG